MAKKTSHSQEKSSKEASAPLKAGSAEKTFLIKNALGLHARAAAQFVKIAGRFGADVFVSKESAGSVPKDSQEVNGKSIMGILMLAAAKGSRIVVRAEGSDGDEALVALEELIENKFGEG